MANTEIGNGEEEMQIEVIKNVEPEYNLTAMDLKRGQFAEDESGNTCVRTNRTDGYHYDQVLRLCDLKIGVYGAFHRFKLIPNTTIKISLGKDSD